MKERTLNNYIAPSISCMNVVADERFMAGSGTINGTGTSISYDNDDQEWD